MRKAQLAWLRIQILTRKILRVAQAIAKHEISRYPDFIEAFEQRYAASVGRQYGLTFCNGTSAIEAALFAANIQPGDEVIVPSCTFHASIDPILNAGAVPVFADITETTLTIDPVDVARKLTPKTKAVIAVHLWGIPADMQTLRQILAGRNIALIEDVSHAHGSRWGDRACGAWGDFGVFSLQGSKPVAAGEGSIVVTDSWEHYIRMSAWGHFDRHSQHFAAVGLEAFGATGIGYKRRMAPLGALLADVDLDYLNVFNRVKQQHTDMLDQALSGIEGIGLVELPSPAHRGGFYQGYPVRIVQPGVSAQSVLAAFAQAGIQAQAYPFALHHRLPVYTDLAFRQALLTQQQPSQSVQSQVHLPVTEALEAQLILLSPNYLLELDRQVLHRLKTVLVSALSADGEDCRTQPASLAKHLSLTH